jgi:hypothetical protein
MVFAIRVGRGALMKARKPKNRAGELLDTGGCIFLMEPEIYGCGVTRPLGVHHLKGKLGAFGSFPEVVFPGGKPLTELASKLLKPCLSFPEENILKLRDIDIW